MFIDKARIYVEAGNGGDGMSSFRREKFVEKGGPNGGNGGRGGNVILRADNSLNTLIDFRYKRKFIAKRGDNGGVSNMTGHRGEDVIIKVPLGTVVRDDETNIMIADKGTPAMPPAPNGLRPLRKKGNREPKAGCGWN